MSDTEDIGNNGAQKAFPISLDGFHFDGGLTKREYFAGKALQGLLSNSNYMGAVASQLKDKELVMFSDVGLHARLYADALLTELEKPTT